MECKTYDLDHLKDYKYVVILAKYGEDWVFCRHKERITWESAGGHIEASESPKDAASRELHEETGALHFKLEPVFDFCLDNTRNGKVFFAEIYELGELPDNEMAEISYFKDLPHNLTYPDITEALFDRYFEMTKGRHMVVNYEKDEKTIAELKESIRDFNNDRSPYHKASRQEGYVKHILITEKDGNKMIGGISARLYWNMIYLDEFFVKEAYRKTGMGSKLLQKLIDIAKEKGVDFICLETYSFQARDFYEKFGFYVIGEIKDYPPGESMYTMRLDFGL